MSRDFFQVHYLFHHHLPKRRPRLLNRWRKRFRNLQLIHHPIRFRLKYTRILHLDARRPHRLFYRLNVVNTRPHVIITRKLHQWLFCWLMSKLHHHTLFVLVSRYNVIPSQAFPITSLFHDCTAPTTESFASFHFVAVIIHKPIPTL